MPRVSIIQTNFTGGEWSPRLNGRVDIDRYNNSVKRAPNCFVRVQGGIKRRYGTRYVQAAKIAGMRSALVPFVFSSEAQYLLEFSSGFIRFFRDGEPVLSGGVPYEIASPYTLDKQLEIDFVQDGRRMYIAHPLFPIHVLESFGNTNWRLAPANFTMEPFKEQGRYPNATVGIPSGVTGPATLNAPSGAVLEADVGRAIIFQGGSAVITAYLNAFQFDVDIRQPFDTVNLPAGQWQIDISPVTTLKPSSIASGNDVRYPNADLSLTGTASGSDVVATASGTNAIFSPSDVGGVIEAGGGRGVITAYTDALTVVMNISNDFPSATFNSGDWTVSVFREVVGLGPVGSLVRLRLDARGWRADDVGKIVRGNSGLLRITEVLSTTEVNATMLVELSSDVAIPALAWSLEDSQWNDRNGYPSTLTLHQQRLYAAGSEAYSKTIWASRIGEPLDFTLGLADDEAFAYDVSGDDNDEIQQLSSDSDIVVLTYGSEFILTGGVEKPITPTSIQARPQSSYGAREARPLQIGSETLFVQRPGFKVRSMAYRIEADRYVSSDISVFADHLLQAKVRQIAYLQEPNQLLVGLRDDGVLLFCTYDREQGVIAFCPQYTDGAFESIATLPGDSGDELWCTVRRVVDGNVVRYIERFEPDWVPVVTVAPDPNVFPQPEPPANYGYTLDCATEFLFPLGDTELTGLGHLEGKAVTIIVDGLRHPDKVVTDGAVTLDRTAYKVLVGLFYLAEAELLNPEVGTGTGTAQGNSMRIFECTAFLLNTAGCRINGQDVAFQAFGDSLLDQPVTLYTGRKAIENLGADRGSAPILITQPFALPFEVSAIVRKLSVND